MKHYPVYRIHRPTGVITRIGSLLESSGIPVRKTAPFLRAEAQRVFSGGPGDILLVVPRLVPGAHRHVGVHRLPD